jgi:hypothetical protein
VIGRYLGSLAVCLEGRFGAVIASTSTTRMSHRRAASRAVDVESRIAESIAAKVIELVRAELTAAPDGREREWIDSAEVARRSGFSRAWVYENAGRLGGVPVGDGPRPRLRFDPARVTAFLDAHARRAPEQPPVAAPPQRHVPRITPMVPNRKGQ